MGFQRFRNLERANLRSDLSRLRASDLLGHGNAEGEPSRGLRLQLLQLLGRDGAHLALSQESVTLLALGSTKEVELLLEGISVNLLARQYGLELGTDFVEVLLERGVLVGEDLLLDVEAVLQGRPEVRIAVQSVVEGLKPRESVLEEVLLGPIERDTLRMLKLKLHVLEVRGEPQQVLVRKGTILALIERREEARVLPLLDQVLAEEV